MGCEGYMLEMHACRMMVFILNMPAFAAFCACCGPGVRMRAWRQAQRCDIVSKRIDISATALNDLVAAVTIYRWRDTAAYVASAMQCSIAVRHAQDRRGDRAQGVGRSVIGHAFERRIRASDHASLGFPVKAEMGFSGAGLRNPSPRATRPCTNGASARHVSSSFSAW